MLFTNHIYIRAPHAHCVGEFRNEIKTAHHQLYFVIFACFSFMFVLFVFSPGTYTYETNANIRENMYEINKSGILVVMYVQCSYMYLNHVGLLLLLAACRCGDVHRRAHRTTLPMPKDRNKTSDRYRQKRAEEKERERVRESPNVIPSKNKSHIRSKWRLQFRFGFYNRRM